MKERPILFSGPMVRAILAGRKTQTRRVMKLPRTWIASGYVLDGMEYADPGLGNGGYLHVHRPTDQDGVVCDTFARLRCPFGIPGDQLWVREASCEFGGRRIYRADYGEHTPISDGIGGPWKPSIHMPRRFSRLTLEVVAVRVERVQDITAEDCIAEGLSTTLREHDAVVALREGYQQLWDALNAKRGYGWAVNPWVFVISFHSRRSPGGQP